MKPSRSHSEAIELAAATWVQRRDRGLTAAEQDEFLSWLAADPRHSAVYARLQRGFSRLDLLATWRPEHGPRPNPDLLAPAVPVTLFTWLGGHRLAMAAFATAAVFAVGFFVAVNRTPAPASPAPPVLLATIEQRTLDDGSVIELNRGAQLSVLYTPAERRVRLERGEAHFTVAKNPDRPFIVTAGGISVRAVGTAFNVRLEATAVEVLVTEGKVGVLDGDQGRSLLPPQSGGETPVLVAGERAVVPLSAVTPPQVTALSAAEMDSELAWQPKLLDYTETPLSEVVGEFNRRNPVHIVLGEAKLGSTPITASLRSDNVEGFVRLMEMSFGVRAERSGDTITLRK